MVHWIYALKRITAKSDNKKNKPEGETFSYKVK